MTGPGWHAVMRWLLLAGSLAAWSVPHSSHAQATGLMGDWVEPTGSAVRIGRCGSEVCLWIISLSTQAKARNDIFNPNAGLRSRALCGLKIGSGFILRDDLHATGGTLYDPKTGKTYHGMLTAQGTSLVLRGYIGFSLFGRSQTWTRPAGKVKACVGEPHVKGSRP